ncbi:MAG: hypothetical protein KAX38_03885, partial [Candidatus Krumholzibacteria bacterium]|nr:hypothetical protein [Candidatus Krumholzibacteria bacterium]
LYYFSLNRYEQSRTKGETPFTPAVQIVQMVHRSLSGIKSLGWEAMRRRHEKSSRAFLAAAPHISLSSFPEEPSSAVLALVLPTRCRGVGIVEELAEKKGIIAADGQELLKGMMIRTGFLGLYGGKTIRRIVTSLGAVIEGHGCSVDIDSAEKAVESLSDQEDIFR